MADAPWRQEDRTDSLPETERLAARVRELEREVAILRDGAAGRSESEKRLALYHGTMTDVIWTSDLYFRWNWMSPSVYDLLGYTAAETLALTPEETLTPASLHLAMKHLEEGLRVIFADKSIVRWPHPLEMEQIRKDGTTVWTEVRVTIMRTEDGTPYGYLGVTRDISRRKAAEEALLRMTAGLEARVAERTRELSEREAFLRAINEHAADIVSIVDREGTVHYYSASTRRILGFAPEEFVGRKVWELLHPDDIPRIGEAIVALFANPDSVARVEYRYRRKDGEYRLLESVGTLLPDWRESGRFVVNSRDVTEQRRLEAEAERARKIESIGLLAGGIAHDFNNLLTVVAGNLGLLRRAAAADPRTATLLDRCDAASLRARELTHQLLTFARGGAPIRRAASFPDLIEDSARFALAGSPVRLVREIAPDLHPGRVDPGQMARVFGNLLINAREAMPGGGTIRVAARNARIAGTDPAAPDDGMDLLAPGDYLEITVEDDGPGIPEAMGERVFDPYFTTKPSGNGLGLAIAHSIVARHDGRLALERSELGGARFRLIVPAAVGETVECEETAPAPDEPLAGRVLVMDDEPEILAVMLELLEGMGLSATGVPDGEAAAAAAHDAVRSGRPFDAAILDLTVRGGMGGIETARALGGLAPRPRLIVSSGYSDDPVLADPAAYGFDDLLPKPWNPSAAARVLARAIRGAP